MKSVFRISVCLLCCVGLILGCFPVKAEASALAATVGIGVAACLILMSAGVVFNPQTVEDIQAIGQSFQTYMYKWGESNNAAALVENFFASISITNPLAGSPIAPKDKVLKLKDGVIAGIRGWVAAIMLDQIKINDSDYPTTSQGYTGFQGNMVEYDRFSSFPSDFPFYDFLELAYRTETILPVAMDSNYILGLYWNEYGVLYKGIFNNDKGSVHATDFTLIPADSLTFVSSLCLDLCYSMETVRADPDFLTSKYYAIDWDYHLGKTGFGTAGNDFKVYEKTSTNSVFISSTKSYRLTLCPDLLDFDYPDWSRWSYWYFLTDFDYLQGETIVPSIVGNLADDLENGVIQEDEIPLVDLNYSQVLPEHMSALQGIQNIGNMMAAGDLTVDEYLAMTYVGSSTAATPAFVTNIPYGSSITYTQGAAAAPITVLATSSDGGTLSYEWYRYGTGEDGKVYPVEVLGTSNSFIPSTAEVGTSYYYCKVTNVNSDGLYATNMSSSIAVEVTAAPGIDSEPGTETARIMVMITSGII